MKEAFDLFVIKDDYRQSLQSIFLQKDYFYATDASSAIRVACKDADGDFSNCPTVEDIKISDIYANCVINFDKTIQIADLNKRLQENLVMVDEEVENEIENKCRECDGSGEVEWVFDGIATYEKFDDCPLCDGTGKSHYTEKKKTGKQVPLHNAIYSIFGFVVSYFNLQRLISACILLGVKEIKFVSINQLSGNLFLCDKVQIIIMPVISFENKKILYE